MNRVVLILGALAVVLIAIAIVTSKKARVQNNPGEIYSVQDRNGYKVVKILAVDSRAVHVRIYKNYSSHRPQSVDVNMLTLGSVYDADGFGVGHLPLPTTTFSSWLPMLISRTTVTQEELEGYEEWKKSSSADHIYRQDCVDGLRPCHNQANGSPLSLASLALVSGLSALLIAWCVYRWQQAGRPGKPRVFA
jgi:hypothetical protein